MISQEIALDKLIDDIDVQIEILTAISDNNAILSEQLRLLYESREQHPRPTHLQFQLLG